jgi:hypothetical protein
VWLTPHAADLRYWRAIQRFGHRQVICGSTISTRAAQTADVHVSPLEIIRPEEIAVFHFSKPLRVSLVAIGFVAVGLGCVFWSWSFTTSRLNAARSVGVFPSPSAGMLTLVHAGWTGIQEASDLGSKFSNI